MSKPSIEEIVADIESHDYDVTNVDARALIASWRERGEALQKIVSTPIWSEFTPMVMRATARAALGSEPKAASGGDGK